MKILKEANDNIEHVGIGQLVYDKETGTNYTKDEWEKIQKERQSKQNSQSQSNDEQSQDDEDQEQSYAEASSNDFEEDIKNKFLSGEYPDSKNQKTLRFEVDNMLKLWAQGN